MRARTHKNAIKRKAIRFWLFQHNAIETRNMEKRQREGERKWMGEWANERFVVAIVAFARGVDYIRYEFIAES